MMQAKTGTPAAELEAAVARMRDELDQLNTQLSCFDEEWVRVCRVMLERIEHIATGQEPSSSRQALKSGIKSDVKALCDELSDRGSFTLHQIIDGLTERGYEITSSRRAYVGRIMSEFVRAGGLHRVRAGVFEGLEAAHLELDGGVLRDMLAELEAMFDVLTSSEREMIGSWTSGLFEDALHVLEAREAAAYDELDELEAQLEALHDVPVLEPPTHRRMMRPKRRVRSKARKQRLERREEPPTIEVMPRASESTRATLSSTALPLEFRWFSS